jgi:hypothetical protein
MSTAEMVHQAGAWSVACVLLLALAVIVLRLLSLPFALTAMALDKAAELAARPLNFTTRPDWRGRQ